MTRRREKNEKKFHVVEKWPGIVAEEG